MGMTMVTDEMVQAARRCMPARWSMDDLRNAIAAAIAAAPPIGLVFDQNVTITPEQQAEWERVASDPVHRNFIQVYTPTLHSALDHPLVLGGISEIATRLEVARSTVVGWIKRAEKIGMPGPIAVLAAGPVFDLTAVETWHKAWKAGEGADGEADA